MIVKTPKGVAPFYLRTINIHVTRSKHFKVCSQDAMPWNPLRNIASVCLKQQAGNRHLFQAVPNFHDSMSETILRPWSLYSLLRDSALINQRIRFVCEVLECLSFRRSRRRPHFLKPGTPVISPEKTNLNLNKYP